MFARSAKPGSRTSLAIAEAYPPAYQALRSCEAITASQLARIPHTRIVVPAQQRPELLLPSDQGQRPQVRAVELHEIEGPHAQSLVGVPTEVKPSEVGCTVLVADDDLAVDDRAPAGQGQHPIADPRKPFCELAPVPRKDHNTLAGLVELAAVAVEF